MADASFAAGFAPVEAAAWLASELDTDGTLSGSELLDRVPRVPPPFSISEIPDPEHHPDLVGLLYERMLASETRRAQGVHFTPRRLTDRLIALALDDRVVPGQVCDPSAGSGSFLLAAARSLAERGVAKSDVVANRLFGSDLDAEALVVADAALTLWSGGTSPGNHLVTGDAVGTATWDRAFDVVVGNPPFQSQLATITARDRAAAPGLVERFGTAALGYVDSAALFLLAALELVTDGGLLLMIQPHSTLAATDAAGVRQAITGLGGLRAVWIGGRGQFEAEVEVCALLVEKGSKTNGPVRLLTGDGFDEAPPHDSGSLAGAATWSVLLAATSGVPTVELDTHGSIGDLATATAGFRDQFYGLAQHTFELGDGDSGSSRLVTVGMLDPARCRWGSGEFAFNRRRWRRPAVRLTTLAEDDPGLHQWVADRLVPKVCVATQTRVVEAAVDRAGEWVPATPVISVQPERGNLWLVAAALMAPPVSAWAMCNHAGAALSSDALRLSAKQVLALPLPGHRERWESGSARLRAASDASAAGDPDGWIQSLREFGALMCEAYGVTDEAVLAWWESRLPPWR